MNDPTVAEIIKFGELEYNRQSTTAQEEVDAYTQIAVLLIPLEERSRVRILSMLLTQFQQRLIDSIDDRKTALELFKKALVEKENAK